MAVQLDVTQPSSVIACIDQVVQRFCCIDILVNNAGVFQRRAAIDLADSDFSDCLDVNLTGMWRTIQATLPHFRRQGGGRVVNIASSGGRRGVGFAPAYCASKAGVISLTQSFALALGSDRINVNAVCPGAVETDMRQEIRQLGVLDGVAPIYALSHPLTAEDVALAVVFLASDYAKSITGQTLNVDRGYLFN
jgi:NAD(P)-dependent dehydrogenase (short-subunit alcohol dehydrogenase family)